MSSAFQNYAIYRLRAFTRLISGFHRERIPVLNFSELDTDNSDLDVSLRLRRTFENLKGAASSGSGKPRNRLAIRAWLGSMDFLRLYSGMLIGGGLACSSAERSSSDYKAAGRLTQRRGPHTGGRRIGLMTRNRWGLDVDPGLSQPILVAF